MNKQCNLAICLMHTNRIPEAKSLLQAVKALSGKNPMDDSYAKSYDRAYEELSKLEQESELKLNGKDVRSSKERSRSSSSSITSSVEGANSSSINRSRQHHVSDSVVRRELYCGNHLENKANFTVDDNRNSHCTSLRAESCLKYSQHAVSENKWKQDHTESSGKSRSGFSSVDRNRVGSVGTDPSSLHKKTYFSPAPARCNQKTPFTQPQRCLWGFSDGDQRREDLWGKDVVGNSRKNCAYDEGWRRKNSWENGDVRRNTHEECLNLNMTAAESPMDFGNMTLGTSVGTTTTDDWTSGEKSSGKVEILCQTTTETPKLTLDSSVCNKKKSWADMAEEEEDEEPCAKADEFFSSWNGEEFNGTPCLHTQIKDPSRKLELFHGCWYSEQEFNDENKNSNVLQESPCLQSQMKKLTRKLEFYDFKDEDNVIHGSTVSSGNPTARRTLCFDQQHQKRGSVCSSPVPKKAVNFDASNSAQAKGRRCSLSEKNIKLLRRNNRLKVFQDITLHPASP